MDGVEGEVQPGETESFNAASQQFRNGDFKNAAASFRTFISKFPNSPYQPTAQYWLGNALYALRDYKGSTATAGCGAEISAASAGAGSAAGHC